MYARYVAQLTRKRTVKLDGCATEAMRPAATPPIAAPRFIVSRCSAYAGERRAGGVSAASERRLRRPERAAARAPDDVDRERLPRRADERHERERDRHHDERAGEHALRPDPVGERAGEEAARERRRGLRRRGEPGEPERDPAHVVQIDDQERQDDAVAERVQQPAGLQHVDVPRQAWVRLRK